MPVTVDFLNKSGARRSEFDAKIQEQLAVIESALKRHAVIWGLNVVYHSLPRGMTYGGLSVEDSERLLYASLITAVERWDPNFQVLIDIEEKSTTLITAWEKKMSPAEIEAMNTVIRTRRVRNKAIPPRKKSAAAKKTAAGGGAAAPAAAGPALPPWAVSA